MDGDVPEADHAGQAQGQILRDEAGLGEQAVAVARTLRHAEAFPPHEVLGEDPGASLGFAIYPQDGDSLQTLLMSADKAAALKSYRAELTLEAQEEEGQPFKLEGKLLFENPTRRRLEIQEAGGQQNPGSISFVRHQRNFQAFLRALDENREFPFSGPEARKSIALIMALYKSGRSGVPTKPVQ